MRRLRKILIGGFLAYVLASYAAMFALYGPKWPKMIAEKMRDARRELKDEESFESFNRMIMDPDLNDAFMKYMDACEEDLGRPGTVGDLVPWLKAQPATFESVAFLSALGEA